MNLTSLDEGDSMVEGPDMTNRNLMMKSSRVDQPQSPAPNRFLFDQDGQEM
jgi:hypothetical protein